MIRVRWTRRSGHMKIVVDGHEPGAKHGEGIICATISGMMQAAVAGLMSVANTFPDKVEIEEIAE